jgi:hypothetical protein
MSFVGEKAFLSKKFSNTADTNDKIIFKSNTLVIILLFISFLNNSTGFQTNSKPITFQFLSFIDSYHQ